MVKYQIEKEIALLGRRKGKTIELNLIGWGNNSVKYDIRKWDYDGTPGKGLALK